MFDALERAHQCATIQLDFQLPIRFRLKYQCKTVAKEGEGEEGAKAEEAAAAPVMEEGEPGKEGEDKRAYLLCGYCWVVRCAPRVLCTVY